MMNKIFTTILAGCICASASAAVINISDARAYANKFFGGSRDLTPISSDAILGQKTGNVAPTFYVINNPSGGWMILSGEDSASPVLAYSKTGSFRSSDMCPSTLDWMQEIDAGIGKLRASNATRSEAVKARWDAIGIRTKAGDGEVVLETAQWNQSKPFNNLCPQIGGRTCVTGCVATAMAIICRYHQWPVKGKGASSAYVTETSKIQIPARDFNSNVYKWSEMPLEYDNNWTSTQEAAVALLMYDIGVMVRMDYTVTGSGAASTEIVGAFKSHLSYSRNTRSIVRQNMDLNEWFDIMKAEIDADRPVLFSGSTADMKDGHAFVCDGYNSNHMIHINWGWGGAYNGYYAVTWLGDEDEEKIGHVFNGYEEAVIGARPDKNEEYTTSAANLCMWAIEKLSGITLKSGTPATGDSFTLDIGYIGNCSTDTDYSGNIKAVLIDKNWKTKEDISEPVSITIKKMSASGEVTCSGISNVKCTITGSVSPGDAIAIMYSQPDGSWARIGGDPDSHAISLMSVYDACFIGNSSSYNASDCIYPTLIQSHKSVEKIEWTYDGNSLRKGYATAESGEHKLKAEVTFTDGTTETVIHPIKVN